MADANDRDSRRGDLDAGVRAARPRGDDRPVTPSPLLVDNGQFGTALTDAAKQPNGPAAPAHAYPDSGYLPGE